MRSVKLSKFVIAVYWILIFSVITARSYGCITKETAITIVALLFCVILIFNRILNKK